MINRKKPELLVTAKDLTELELLMTAGADALSIGSEKYGLRLPGDFSLEMIQQAVALAHSKHVKIYVVMNALLHNELIEGLEDYIKNLSEFGVDGIVFGDPAILVTANSVAPKIPLHWNTETTSTNYETVNYWAKKGATRAVLARELSLNEVIEIKKNVNVEVQVQIHGMTCIFHSKRSLVTDYYGYLGKENELNRTKDQGLFVREHKRPNEKFPIYEDEHGTHIMSDHDLCMIDYLDRLMDAGIDSLKIEGIMQSTDYLVNVVSLYREAIDKLWQDNQKVGLMEKVKELQPKDRPLTTGFYFKEQYY